MASNRMKKYIFWEYARGSWQYDVIVGVIVAFLFLTPRDWFRDQPRIPQASDISSLPSERGTHQYFVDREALAGVADDGDVYATRPIHFAATDMPDRFGW